MLHILVCDDEETFARALVCKIEALPDFSPAVCGCGT